ncbi:MAG: hypothetical protein ABIU58_12185 [Ramlibacter sp.]
MSTPLLQSKALAAQAGQALPLELRLTEKLLKQFATVVRATWEIFNETRHEGPEGER